MNVETLFDASNYSTNINVDETQSTLTKQFSTQNDGSNMEIINVENKEKNALIERLLLSYINLSLK